MDQKGRATITSKKRKRLASEEDKRKQVTTGRIQNVDDNTVDKSICATAVDLSDDAWLLVFSYLGIADKTRIAKVCTRWAELARISWKSMTWLSIKEMYMSPSATPSYEVTDDLLKAFLQQCEAHVQLQCLDFCRHNPFYRQHRLTSHALDLIGQYCSSLQNLHLSHIKLNITALTAVAEKLPGLRSLDLSYCEGIDDDALRGTLRMLRSLNSLKVQNNEKITGEVFSQVPHSLTEVIASGCWELTDGGVCSLAKKCPNLQTIGLYSCSNLTGQAITDLAENCPKLKSFKFAHNSRTVLTEHLQALSTLPLLEEVFLEGEKAVTDQVFYELGIHCPLLRSVSCVGCEKLTDAAMLHLVSCLHLENINFSYSYGITDIGLLHLSSESAHFELKEANLRGCDNISDEGVGHLLSGHPNLLELDISQCPEITDRLLTVFEESKLQRRQHAMPLKIHLDGTYLNKYDKVMIALREIPGITCTTC